MRITALEPQQRQADRYNLHLDDRFALALDAELVIAEGLSVGMELTEADVERLRAREDERRLLDAALHFLGPRPRSRAEVRRRLLTPKRNRAAPDPDAVERTLDRLERLGVLNDQAFAEFWVENRERFSPRSARALTQELRLRGVRRETVEHVAEPERDEERAIAAGRQRLRALAGLGYADFRTKLGQFLLRRGFSYADARTAVQRLWEETSGTAADTEDDEMGDDEG
jgi:regulatory protein